MINTHPLQNPPKSPAPPMLGRTCGSCWCSRHFCVCEELLWNVLKLVISATSLTHIMGLPKPVVRALTRKLEPTVTTSAAAIQPPGTLPPSLQAPKERTRKKVPSRQRLFQPGVALKPPADPHCLQQRAYFTLTEVPSVLLHRRRGPLVTLLRPCPAPGRRGAAWTPPDEGALTTTTTTNKLEYQRVWRTCFRYALPAGYS